MTPKEVYNYFGSGYVFNKKTGMSKSSMTNWIKRGFVPLDSQVKLHNLTNGELKANVDDVIENNKN